jgi:hypothetical protein
LVSKIEFNGNRRLANQHQKCAGVVPSGAYRPQLTPAPRSRAGATLMICTTPAKLDAAIKNLMIAGLIDQDGAILSPHNWDNGDLKRRASRRLRNGARIRQRRSARPLFQPADQTRTSGRPRLSKGRSQLRRPYVGARNSPRNQPSVRVDFIGSTSATTR